MAKGKNCESCGMPMRKSKDFGGQDAKNKYCCHCADDSGVLKNYKDIVEGLTNFLVEMQGLEREQAEQTAKEGLAKMPAWKNR